MSKTDKVKRNNESRNKENINKENSNKAKIKFSSDYRQLKTKIFFNTVTMLVIAVFAIQFLYRFVFYGHFANWVVKFLEVFIYRDYTNAYDVALDTYRRVFREYISLYFLTGVVLVFAVVMRIYLNNFIKYFNEINHGIDALVKENAGDVVLSQELAATEKKINSIKHTLEKRKTDALLAEQRKNDLIVYLAHDLKTPLTSVIGYLTLLQDEPQISQEMRCRYTGIVLEKAQRLEDLINEFFDITRFNLTTLTLENEQINLSRMLEQIVSEFDPILKEKELRWQTDIEPGIELCGDTNKLARVFDNLIRNAVNYSYASTEILFLARTDGAQVNILVKNHGKTIPADKLEHIFEQFYRVDASRASATGGAGLGLAIAKEIVELHGGIIKAESAEESISFLVTLPVDRKKIV